MNKYMLLACSSLLSGHALFSQCTIDAGNNLTLANCGEQVLLSANPAWSTGLDTMPLSQYAVHFLNSDTGYTAGYQASIHRTLDGGKTWSHQKMGNYLFGSYASVFFTDFNNGFVFGGESLGADAPCLIAKTTDAGITWNEISTGYKGFLNSCYFTSPTTGFAVGYGGLILKTEDGGNTWVKKTNNSPDLFSIFFVSPLVGYATGAATILKTTDGGEVWTNIIPGSVTAVYLREIYFSDASTGFMIGDNSLYKTTDGGTTWNATVIDNNLRSLSVIDPTTIYVGGSGTIFKSQDGGKNWKSQKVDMAEVADIHFPNAHVGYATGLAGFKKTIKYKSSDAIIWTPSSGLSNANIENPIAKPLKTTTYKITAMFGNCTAIDSVTVFVNPLEVNAGNSQTLICGSTAQLNLLTNYTGSEVLNYVWSPATGLSATNIPNPVASVKQTTTFSVHVTTPSGCVADDSISVIVHPLTIDAGNNKSHSCGESIQLPTVTNYTGSGSVNYLWTPSTGLSNPTAAAPNTNAGPITYTVTMTTSEGCTASDVINVTLAPLNAPQICMVGVDSADKNVIVWNTQPGAAVIKGFNIYKETTVAGNFVKIGSVPGNEKLFKDMASLPLVKSNKYKISVVDTCGVETSQSLHHKTMHLAITKGLGTSWNLIWEHYEGFSVPTYTIYRGTNKTNLQFYDAVSGGSNQYTDYNPPPGDLYYQVEVVNPQSCEAGITAGALRSNVASNNPSNINKNESELDFTLYPNPANEILTIHIEQPIRKEMTVEFYNSVGMLVKKAAIQQSTGQIMLDDLSNGIYLIELKSTNGISRKKVTIQR